MDGAQKQRRTTPSAPPPSKSAIKKPEPPGESLLSLLQRGTSSKDLLSFSSSAKPSDNSRNTYLVSPDKSRECNEVLHFVDPAVAALGPSHPITFPLQNPNNIEDAENPLLQYAIGTPHPHNFHHNLNSIPNIPLNYLPPPPSWIPQTFNSDVSGGFLGFPPPPSYAFSNVQSQERFASPDHSQFSHVHQNASGNDAMLGPQTRPHVHSQDVRKYPLQTEPKTFSTLNSERNAFSTHDSDTAQGKKSSAPKSEGKMVLDSKREGKMLAASFSVPATGKSESKKYSAPVMGKAEMKVVVRPQGDGSEEGSVNLMFGSLDWNSEKLHAEEKGKVKGGVCLLRRPGSSQAQGSGCIAESSKVNQRNEQYQSPQDGKYQAPRNGQYQAPRNGKYQYPRNEQYHMPRNEQHQTPRNGQYSTPQNERYQMPRNGQYQMPRNGYVVKQKSNVIMNKVNGADGDGVAGELRGLRLDEEYKESELSPSSGGKQKGSGFSQRRRRLKQHFPEGAGEEAKDGAGGTLNFQDSPRYKQRTTQGSSVAFEEEHKLDKNQGMSRNQQLEIENRRVRVKQTQVDINQKRRLQFLRLKEIDFRHCEDLEILTKRFLSIYQSLIPKKEEEAKRGQLLFCLENVVQRKWPESKLHLFGSCANAFGVSNSDIDVCLSIDKEEVTKSELVLELAEILKDEDMQNVQALAHARVPIVKFTDPITKISCDICINNILAVENTKLLYDYAQIDVRLKQLAFMVKHWAKCRNINETYRGTLSSYAYVLMCIHFLQQRRPAILPCLQAMRATYHVKIGNIDCAYYDKVENLREFGYQNKETLGHLLSAFFDYWAFDHDYANSVVSIRTGGLISKRNKDWTRRIGNERHLICIEDPFETSHDLGRVVDKYSIRVIKEEFLRAAEIMHYDSDPSITLFQPCTPRQ